MEPGLLSYGLALAAGGLSTLSPCVLPIVPLLLGAAVAAHRLGPYALAAGLASSFTVLGIALAGFGGALGLDADALRGGGAALLLAFGLVLVSERLQERFALATAGVAGAGQGLLGRVTLQGLSGQFLLGLLLGVVWSPCVGPTLGATVTLASQGRDLAQVTLLMALFGLGAAAPLVGLGLLSRQAMAGLRQRLLLAGSWGKKTLGGVMLLLGALILSGADKRLEAWLLDHAPAWLVTLTTAL